jgi:adenylate cyclase
MWLRRAAATSPQVPTILAGLTSELALTGDDTEARDAGPIPHAGKHPPRTIEQWDYLPDDDDAFSEISPAVQKRVAQGRHGGMVNSTDSI